MRKDKLCISELCTGCTACASICPRNAITMQRDKEGFEQPVIDINKCIDCGLCTKVCPILNPLTAEESNYQLYAVQNKRDKIRKISASGGFFFAIANYMIEVHKAFICGVIFDKQFKVKHYISNNIKELTKFSGSKYVQSSIDGIFPKIKKLLINGEYVLFSGMPCQVTGLLKYLGKRYEKLFTIELVCHGVPSPLFWNEYLIYQQASKNSKVVEVNFKNKKFGYASGSMYLKFADGSTYYEAHDSDPMLYAFTRDMITRRSCFCCNFKGNNRLADYTILDGWHIGRWNKTMNDDKGTTLVRIQNEKARQLFEKLGNELKLQMVATDDTAAIKDSVMLFKTGKPHPLRNIIFEDLNSHGFSYVANKYYKPSIRIKIKQLIKKCLHLSGIMPFLNKAKSRRL